MRLLISILMLLFAAPSMANNALLPPLDAWTQAENGELLIIDVRTPPEWAWTGVPKTAAKANWWQVSGRNGFLKDVLDITGGDRDRPIALICARGVRSSEAADFLRQQGFRNVSDIGEGMLGSRAGPGWLDRKLPLE